MVLCEQYTCKTVTGDFFAEFIKSKFPVAFSKVKNPTKRIFLQDGDPKQVSAKAKKAMNDLGYIYFPIPARSPDLNPIENMFHIVCKRLKEDVINLRIENENYRDFSLRVKKTIESIDTRYINDTIESFPTRLRDIIRLRGSRSKY